MASSNLNRPHLSRPRASRCVMSSLSAAVQDVPLTHQLGAKVEHFYLKPSSEGTMLVVDAVSSHLEAPSDIVKRLLWFGSVYICKVAV